MTVSSPLSPTSKVTLVNTINSEQVIKGWREGFNIGIEEEFKGHSEIFLYKCNDTDLEFFYPLDVAGSAHLYEQLEGFDWYYMPHKWEHDAALADLRSSNKVLEVGCGQGSFVQRMCSEHHIDAVGIEINEQAAKFARERDIPVLQKDLFAFAEEFAETFDAVCAFQVLEHVPEPLSFLKAMIQLLKPGGKLILSVPNSSSFIKFNPNLLLNQPPHHMTRWHLKTFQMLPHLLPLKLSHVRYEPLADYHVKWYLATLRLRYRKRIKKWDLVERVLNFTLSRFGILRRLIKGHTLYVCLNKQ